MVAKLENIRSLIYNECQWEPRLQWFWKSHIVVVEECAKELATQEKANMEIVMLGVYLHDIAQIRKIDDEEKHDIVGAVVAENIMRQYGYDILTIEKVKGLILAHRCKDRKPETLEEKILATADAVSHFRGDFYLYLLWQHDPKETLEASIQYDLEKMERDFREKIFFKSARKKITPAYEAFKFVFSSFPINNKERRA